MKVKNLEEGKIIPLSYDLMFKKVFGDPQDTRPLKYLLKVILGIDAKEITILNNEILGENINSKSTTVDLIAQLEDGTKIGIEMNRTVSQEIIERNLVFMFRIMGSNLRHGESYRLLDKHIQINFNLMGHRQAPIESYKLINTQNVKDVLSEKLEIVCVDIGYFWKRCYTKKEEALKEEDKVIGVMGIEDIKEAHRVISGDEIMEEIMKKVEGFSREDALLVSYDRDFHIKECARIEAEINAAKIVNEAKEKIKEQEEKLQDRKKNLKEKENNLKEKENNLKEKENSLEQKENSLEQKENNLEKKEGNLRQKEGSLRQREVSLREKEEKLKIQEEQIFEHGAKKERIEMVKKLLKENMDLSMIAKITGLSLEEIQSIHN